MTQQSENLRQTLEKLHEELQSTDTVDPQVRALLETTLSDIHQLLGEEAESAAAEEEKSLVDQLSDAADRFEQSHPTLAHTIGRLADVLAQMGI